MGRIAIAGFQHETNTFAPAKATFQDFADGSGWPALQRGESMFAVFPSTNLPIAGAMRELQDCRHDLVPLVWASATPSAEVTEDAFERIAGALLEDLAAALPVDGVYLDLHGAMVTEHLEDGEGELLRRVRSTVGPAVPVVASLDLHANVTPEMLEYSDLMVAYRTYPHVDMADTGARAARCLDAFLRGKGPHYKSLRHLPFLIPLTWQTTLTEPARSIYAEIERIESADLVPSFTPGFPAADIRWCGPAVFAYSSSPQAAEDAASRLEQRILGVAHEFAGETYLPDDAVRAAMARRGSRPILLADTQDNPGAGGTSDTVGLLEALVRNDAQDAVLAVMADSEAVAAGHSAGVGATVTIDLGGKSGAPGQVPFHGTFVVERLGSGMFTGTGPMWGGAPMNLGPMMLLRIGGVRVVTASRKEQAADQAIFRHLGVEPAQQRILALKSSVHFRADFAPIADDILVVQAPGAMPLNPADLPFKRLRPGVRLG